MTSNSCPIVPAPSPETAGQYENKRDSGWDSRGTAGLKALARKVLRRDSGWDTCGTAPAKAVPRAPLAVGQRDSWDREDWRVWFTEPAATFTEHS
jgi:hypothetical protein